MNHEPQKVTFQGVVYPKYLDHMGHMNVQYYVHLFDQGTWILFDRVGLTSAHFAETQCGMAALEQHLSYKREVFAGTVVTITTEVLEVAAKTVRFVHTMSDAQGVVATCELVGAYLDRAAHRAKAFPDEVRSRLEEWRDA